MKKFMFSILAVLFIVLSLLAAGCAGQDSAQKEGQQEDNGTESPAEGFGTLVFTANGEEFIREGFLSKDGWELSFNHAYVTMSNITAYQSNPPYDTEQGWEISYDVKVELEGFHTADLTDPDSDPAKLAQIGQVPSGHYNAISWTMTRAVEGPAEGYSLLLVGKAEKDGQVIYFTLGIEQEVDYLGGDYVGDERKGIVAPGSSADLEMTFHFDHLFGDGEEDFDDEINLEAFGFDPLAALAVNGEVNADLASLEKLLSPQDYELLLSIFTHLAHVGEGHCLARFVN